jgi:hypothetical protein
MMADSIIANSLWLFQLMMAFSIAVGFSQRTMDTTHYLGFSPASDNGFFNMMMAFSIAVGFIQRTMDTTHYLDFSPASDNGFFI